MSTYKDAGVDIDAGEEVVRRIKPLVRKTFTDGVMTDIGAFGAFFDVDWKAYRHPIMVSSVDGVGTKLKVAFRAGTHNTVGHDLVNHCVNDIAVCGAKPLFFLDYFSTGKLSPDVMVEVVEGFSKGCVENGVALIGGETAEMPDLYKEGEYDLAGTIVGVVEKEEIIDGTHIEKGDVLLGFASSGLHTNGYSLARHVLFPRYGLADTPSELDGQSIGASLLAVHRSYLKVIQAMISSKAVHGLVHVTGGGIPGNAARIMPEEVRIEVDYQAWERPGIFRLIQQEGQVPEEDMRRTFNLGIGLVAVVPESSVDEIRSLTGLNPVVMGQVVSAS